MWHKPLGPLVPDLTRIPRDWWRRVLHPLSQTDRDAAAWNQGLAAEDLQAALDLVDALRESPVDVARRELRQGTSIPSPSAEAAVRRRARQVNVRLGEAEYARLVAAAELLGDRPGTIARILVNNGTRRVLADHAVVVAGAE